jgi:orotidine-5'-phosphate decarboxylase
MDAGTVLSDPAPAIAGNSEIREPSQTFGDRLAELVGRRESQLVLGLDPDPARLWPSAICPPSREAGSMEPASPAIGAEAGSMEPASPAVRAAAAVGRHCALVIEATAPECVAVKLQVACFERLGSPGWAALEEVADTARRAGLLVIADAKCGDIDVSAQAYAEAFLGETSTPFGPVAGLGADALTVNPLLGRDSLLPFTDTAAKRGAGLFVLARTSNPGAADIQELELADGELVGDRLARLIAELGNDRVGRSGLSEVGAVVGATAPHRLVRMRELMPHAVMLLPGVGAQGGSVEELAPVFALGRAAGLVSASRAIVYAHQRDGSDPAESARREAARLRELVWKVAG